MQRIMIIGCAGTGKSTLAKKLGAKLDLPVYHLDSLFWQPGWEKPEREKWLNLQAEICAQPKWIMDGNYDSSLEIRLASADTVIFIDLPVLQCLSGVLRRYLRYRGKSRPDMAPGCPEQLDWEFIKWILNYRRKARPVTLRLLEEAVAADKQLLVLRSRRAVRRFEGNIPIQRH